MAVSITEGWGKREENSALVAMINEVFSPHRDDSFDFYKLLPKLYLDKYNPAQHNAVVREDGVIKGAVGLFYGNLKVGDGELLCGGIGNVAVTLDSRSKGYMKKCMNIALEDMISKKTDIGFLGGQRQRYAYFSFEQGGSNYSFRLSMRNMHHVFGTDADTDFTAEELSETDNAALDCIYALHQSKSFRFERPREDFYNIMCSWSDTPVVLRKNGEFKGYYITNKDRTGIDELTLVNEADIKDACLAIFDFSQKDTFNISFPPFEKAYIKFFSDVAETTSFHNAETITVLNYKNTLNTLLRFKASYTPLCNCEYSLLIHGKAGDERLHISVKNNVVTVTDTDEKEDLELEHLEAVRALFGICPPRADEMSAEFKALLPIPFFVNGADNV